MQARGAFSHDRHVPDRSGLDITRRTFLGTSAAGTAYVAALARSPFGRYLDGVSTRVVETVPRREQLPRSAGNVINLSLDRDGDLLQLDMIFYFFKVDTTSTPVSLVPTRDQNLIYVYFPPQAIGEGVYPYAGGTFEVDPPPVLSVVADSSTLVFTIGTDETIPLPTMTIEDLLDWKAWTLLVPDVATTTSTVAPTEPDGTSCLIECPYGLYLSPVVNPTVEEAGTLVTSYVTNFVPSPQPTTTDGVTECFSARLTYEEVTTRNGGRPAAGDARPRDAGPSTVALTPLVSAVWCRDAQLYDDINGVSSFPSSMTDSKYFATPTTTQIPKGE